MDIIFKCPHCDQELEVDASGAGSKIECPACSQTITVPTAEEAAAVEEEESDEAAASASAPPAPEPKHFVVPVHSTNAEEPLISKAMRPLEVAAKDTDRKLRIKTIRHPECVEVGKDRFDEKVSAFLEKIGQENIVSINTINFSSIDVSSHQAVTDFGVVIVYKG